MMQYQENNENNLLFRVNPIIKIINLFVITFVITFDYSPFLSTVLLILCIGFTTICGRISLKSFLYTLLPFLMLSVGFSLFTLIAKGMSNKSTWDFTLLALKWSKGDILICLALGVRIITIVAYSASFVITTNPVDFIISLIKYLHLPYRVGYSVLAAYRFLPNFKNELTTIQFAHEIRGVKENAGIKDKIYAFKRYLIPMLASAVRKGERMSFAMESRGFGMHSDRTYYREVQITIEDIVFITILTFINISLIILLYKFNLTNFSLGFNLH